MTTEEFNLKKRLKSFNYAFRGIGLVVKTQFHFRIHLLAALLVTGGGFYFHISSMEWCVLVICFGLVLAAECINTALEMLTDLACPGYHLLAEKSKDIAAGAVLVCALFSVITAAIIFIPKFLS